MTVVIPLNDFLTESNDAEYNIFLLMQAVSGHQQTRKTRVLADGSDVPWVLTV
jgi:hypothetical protein